MQYMNSSPSMTMLLQPDFSRPPPNQGRGWQPVHQPRPPVNVTASNPNLSMQARPYSSPTKFRPSSSTLKGRIKLNGNPNSYEFDATFTPHPPSRSINPQPPSGGVSVYPYNEVARKNHQYNSLYDPHLVDYFTKKLQAAHVNQNKWSAFYKPKGGSGFTFSPTRCYSCAELSHHQRDMIKSRRFNKRLQNGDILYKVTVRTADKAGAGTSARVFLRMVGRTGKVNKWRLFKKSGQQNINMFRFAKGTSHLFKHRGPNIGEIQKIVVEHDGVSERDSWLLKEIVVEDTRREKTYTFSCDKWLSLYKEDCHTSRELFAVNGRQTRKITYEVTTVTGQKRGAGTNSNVFVTFKGSKGTSPKIPLNNKKKVRFERGKSNIFNVKTVDVGKLKKIRIEQDGEGSDPTWYLDRVVVVNMSKPSERIYFPCGQWLSTDKKLHRELHGSYDPLTSSKMNVYTIHTFTGDVSKASSDANVHVILFGERGESGTRMLEHPKGLFARGKKDSFVVECRNVGKLRKIRIGHDNSGAKPNWFLDKVVIDDSLMENVYTFPCQQWLSKNIDDGKIERELVLGKEYAGTGIPYTIQVFTGDVRGAGTDAQVYIILHGGKKKQDSEKITLDGKFERNRVDVCNIECDQMLSPLEKIEIGHDDSGIGAAWYLDKVVITCADIGCEQVFVCRNWLASDEGDGLICRELFESKSLRKQVVKKSPWNCTIWTSDIKNAGTDAKVFIQVYGSKGKSDEIELKNEADNFETGQKDNFKIELEDVGTIYKLRVWHDNSDMFAGWHLDRMVLEPVTNKKSSSSNSAYTFKCGRWLDENKEDGEVVRELPASGANVKKPQPLLTYRVNVQTGDTMNAGTDADVFCCIYGEQGDTGDRKLRKSQTHRNKFERGNTDEFLLEAVSLKGIQKVKIGHNDGGAGPGWFLDKVTVSEDQSNALAVFPCQRWLATDEDDGLIVRELLEQGSPQLLNTTSYHVSIKTGDVRGAGTDANVYIKIFGENGDTGKLKVHQSDGFRNKFERGRTDTFKLEAADIGKIQRIYIGHDDSGMAAGWFLDGLEIDVPSSGYHYSFNCHRWLAADEGDGKTEVELYPTQTRQNDKMLPYEITVTTGDKMNGGTDANVMMQLYGEDGKSEIIQLRSKTDNFERNAVDKFKIEAPDVGPLKKIRVGHDGKGVGSGWFLDSIKIQRFVERAAKKKKRRKSSSSSEQADVETYWFVCRRWFDKSEDDGHIIRELVPTDEQGRQLDETLQEIEYTVEVFTGGKMGAGTDSNVFITVHGENGDSGERKLESSENINKFERNQKDTFVIKAADLGEMKKLKIRHDNSGFGDAWFLDRIEVRTSAGGKAWVFPCQRWLAVDEDDGQIERTLVPVERNAYLRLEQMSGKQNGKKKSSKTNVRDAVALETKAQLTTYTVNVKTGNIRGSGTDANVYMVLYGENDDSGLVNLKSSKTHRDKFERDNTDVFVVESADLGDLKKIKIGHDNAGLSAGWYLEYVEVDAPSLGMKWKFPCGRWLDKDRDDGQLERVLYPSEEETTDYAAKVPYEIKVYTGDVTSAGTDANVFVVLYGRDGLQTEKTNLCTNKDERKSKFKRKAENTFVLELDDIGENIEKLRIGHDNKGWSSGWFLDKVEVRRLLDGNKGSETFLFTCGRWLARDEDDGEIVRELVPTSVVKETVTKRGKLKRSESTISDSLRNQNYRVHVFTGDVFNAGTDANVFVTIFGENGDTGERKLLKSETNTDKFERGKEDIFNLEAVDLGKIFKIHIRHDNALINPSWNLDRVEVVDTELDERYVFHCERWLAKGKEDGKIARSLYVVGYDGETSTRRSQTTTKSTGSRRSFASDVSLDGPLIPYKVKVTTGRLEKSTLKSNAFLKVFGASKKGKKKQKVTQRIPLEPPNGKFKRGTIEGFSFDALDVGKIKEIEIGHTAVDETWFVEEVTIDQPTLGKTYNFSCNKWFARELDDGKTSRILKIADAERVNYEAKIPYEVTIHTGDVSQAGTDCYINLDVYGSRGSCTGLLVKKSADEGVLLERGSADVVFFEIDDISPLHMIRLSHDGKGKRPHWYCEKVEMRNLDSGKVTVFPCKNWLSLSRGDRLLSRECSASVGGKLVLDTTTYRITVKTSGVRGAGTNANVTCVLFGANGDSGELRLKENDQKGRKFEKGATDVFSFADKINIGDIHKLRIWHDGKGFGAGWHLDMVEVQDTSTDTRYNFPCNRWLAEDEDDHQIIRDLICSNLPESQSRTSSKGRAGYHVSVVTSDKNDAGSFGDAWIVFQDDSGRRSKKLRLEKGVGRRKKLCSEQTSEFDVETKNMEKIEQITMGMIDRDDRLHVEEVKIEHDLDGSSSLFVCESWVTGSREKTFTATSSNISKKPSLANLLPVKYEVVVETADEKGAGTDANVQITIFGSYGDSGKRPLKRRFRDLFERNQTDKFTLEVLDLGDLEKVRIEHDDAGFNADWLCESVTIRKKDSSESWFFPCREWIGNKKSNQLYRDCLLRSQN